MKLYDFRLRPSFYVRLAAMFLVLPAANSEVPDQLQP